MKILRFLRGWCSVPLRIQWRPHPWCEKFVHARGYPKPFLWCQPLFLPEQRKSVPRYRQASDNNLSLRVFGRTWPSYAQTSPKIRSVKKSIPNFGLPRNLPPQRGLQAIFPWPQGGDYWNLRPYARYQIHSGVKTFQKEMQNSPRGKTQSVRQLMAWSLFKFNHSYLFTLLNLIFSCAQIT